MVARLERGWVNDAISERLNSLDSLESLAAPSDVDLQVFGAFEADNICPPEFIYEDGVHSLKNTGVCGAIGGISGFQTAGTTRKKPIKINEDWVCIYMNLALTKQMTGKICVPIRRYTFYTRVRVGSVEKRRWMASDMMMYINSDKHGFLSVACQTDDVGLPPLKRLKSLCGENMNDDVP